MSELVDFLAQRLDEDEAVARAELPAALPADYDEVTLWESEFAHRFDPDHLVNRFDPARVLREVTAKRTILAIHSEVRDSDTFPWCGGCSQPILGKVTPPACDTVRALAAPFCDHPDFQEQWR